MHGLRSQKGVGGVTQRLQLLPEDYFIARWVQHTPCYARSSTPSVTFFLHLPWALSSRFSFSTVLRVQYYSSYARWEWAFELPYPQLQKGLSLNLFHDQAAGGGASHSIYELGKSNRSSRVDWFTLFLLLNFFSGFSTVVGRFLWYFVSVFSPSSDEKKGKTGDAFEKRIHSSFPSPRQTFELVMDL